MVTTKIVNHTKAEVQLREGNAGVVTSTTVLQPGKSLKVSVDPNATYKTYIIASNVGGHLLDLNSDFCTDYKIVYIRVDVDGKVFKDPVPRSAELLPHKKLVNNSGQKIALIEEITPNADHKLSVTIQLLDSKSSCEIQYVDPTAGHRKYYLTKVTGGNGLSEDKTEIIEELKKKNKRVDVTLDSDKLQVCSVTGFFWS